jgi:hypothetical protein
VKKEELMDLITQSEAARLREVSPEAIAGLIRRGRLSVVELGGRKFLRRSEVVNFAALPGGRPAKKAGGKKVATTVSTKKTVSKKKSSKK